MQLVCQLYLEVLSLFNNELSGQIPTSICNIENIEYIVLDNNQFCPPYPECLNENEMGFQDTSECVDIDYCDLNFDGEIDVLDIVIILNCILENEGCDYLCMDYNSDNDIDILDIITMVNIILEN